MTRVSGVNHHEAKKTDKKEAKESQEQTKAKSADINSTQPSERAKQINTDNKIKDGIYKDEHSEATVGDIAQANSLKEDGTVDPESVQQQVVDIVKNNPALADQAKALGIDLENPTKDDLQKLANLDVKAGQEVKVGDKPTEAAKAPEEAKKEEAPAEKAPAEEAPAEAAPAEKAQEAKESPQDAIGKIMELISKAEQSTDPAQKAQYADQAIQMINTIRAEKGVQKGQGNQLQNANGTQNPETQQMVQTIQAGGKADPAALGKILEGNDLNQIAQILDALEQRAVAAKNGNGSTMNALNMFGQNNLAQLGIGAIKLPYMNQAIA